MEEEAVQHVYAAQESGGVWPTVLHSVLMSAMSVLTSVLTISVLLGALVGLLVLNSRWILGMVMSKVLEAVLEPLMTDEEPTDGRNLPFGPDRPIHSHQDTPMPGLYFPRVLNGGKGELRNQVNGELVDTRYFTPHENSILELLVEPSKIGVTWDDIAGSEELISSIKEQVIFPIMYSFQHDTDALLMPPKGVLLHGPPGCGKTLMAKALSSEIKAHFINFDISAIKNKWQGETEKMASALFSVARKLQPCIIFIDEVDSFLNQRADGDQATEQSLKAIFLQQWDGLTTEAKNHVVVLAASNRLDSIDAAIQRRLPLQFNVPLPEMDQRQMILDIILRDCDVEEDVDLKTVAEKTDGFSGSDLQEICRHAATYRLVEFYKHARNAKRKQLSSHELVENITQHKNKLVDPQQLFEKFEQMSQSDLVKQDSAQCKDSCDESSDIWELVSRSSGCHSSFRHQTLPSDIINSLLKDELASHEHLSTGSDQFHVDDLLDERLGDKVVHVDWEGRDTTSKTQEKLIEEEINFHQQISGEQEQQNAEKDLLKQRSSLRPISQADLLRALQYSRKTGQEDIPDGMYN